MLTRRHFLCSSAAVSGGAFLSSALFASEPKPQLRFGVMSDVHIGGRAADGRVTKLLVVSGNHDAAAGWVKGDDAWRTAHVLSHRDNFTRVWERLFHEKWELIWKREVRGFTFIGAQPEIAAGKLVTFTAIPRESFGKQGRPLVGTCQL